MAFLRALVIFATMFLFMVSYLLSTLVIPHSKERAFRLRRNWLKWIAIPVLNIHIDKQGNPISQPALYVCNHRSFSDPIILCRFIDAFVIAKAEVASYPIINKGAELTGVIWVQRQSQNSRKNSRSKMIKTLLDGDNVMVYPEGTVGIQKQTLEFRPGSFLECAANDIPVVPVAIEYKTLKDLWVKEKFIPQYFYQFSKWKTEVKIRIGKPLKSDDGITLCNDAHSWINHQIADMQKNWSRVF